MSNSYHLYCLQRDLASAAYDAATLRFSIEQMARPTHEDFDKVQERILQSLASLAAVKAATTIVPMVES